LPLEIKSDSHRVEEKIGEEAVPLDQDSCGGGEPNGCNHWSCGQKLVHC